MSAGIGGPLIDKTDELMNLMTGSMNNPSANNQNVNNSNSNIKKDDSKFRKAQDDLIKSILTEDEPTKQESSSILPAIIIGVVVALIVATIAYFVATQYFKDQLDSAMIYGLVAVLFLITLVITFFLFKPAPVKKNEVCKV